MKAIFDRESPFGLVASQLRIRQWAKNALVFAPLLFSGERGAWSWFFNTAACAIAFCLLSSATYILNDIFDLRADRIHPNKKNRPLAAGRLGLPAVLILGSVCMLTSFIIAYLIRPTLVLVFLSYLLVNVFYSLYLKHIVLLDIFCVASGFVLRPLAGALAIHIALTGWFLLCNTFGAMFIALEKRRQELVLLEQGVKATRKALKEYSPRLIQRLEALLVPSLLTAYSFYSFQSSHGQWMMITVPLVLYGIMRYQYITEQGNMGLAPEEIFWKDRPIQIVLILWTLTCWIVIYFPPEALMHQLSKQLDSTKSHI